MKSTLRAVHTLFRRISYVHSKANVRFISSSHIPQSQDKELSQSPSTDETATLKPKRNLLKGPNLKDFFTNENLALNYEPVEEKVPYINISNYGCGRKVYFDVYGCQMNVNDTEIIWSILKSNNFIKTDDVEDADVVLIMTCAIRDGAEAKIWNKLEYLKGIRSKKLRKKDGGKMKIGILGCMAERLKEKILDKERTVDVIAGPDSYKDLPRLLALTDNNQTAINVLLSLDETYADIMPVRLNENSVTAFVSIMRGCDNMCTYCIVPFTRGRERSRAVSSIIEEVKYLSEQGVKEITLLGQNVNSYRDLTGNSCLPNDKKTNLVKGFTTVYKPKIGGLRFADLLEQVSGVDPELRIRFTSPHPKDFPDEVLQIIQERPNICQNLHLPAQSGNSTVLERMRRGYTREAYLDLVSHVKEVLPNVALSSDFICGFCGETEEEFQDTLSLMDIVRYNTAYIFAYSMREKTTAHRRYEDDVPQNIKQERANRLYNLYKSITQSLNRQKIGQLQLILVEGTSKRSKLHLAGRNDSNIKVIFPIGEIPIENSNGVKSIEPGDYIVVQINDSSSQVLKGIPLYHTTLTAFNNKHQNSYSRCHDDYMKYTSML